MTRYIRDATHTTREQQLAAFRIRGWFAPRRRLSRDTSPPSPASPSLLSHLPTTARASTSLLSPSPAPLFTSPLPCSFCPVHASLRLVLRCRMGNAVSPPKRVSCPPSRAFQSIFCHLEVCVVTRSRLRSRCFPFGSTGGKRKREEERIKSLVEQQTYICPVHRYPVTRSCSVLSPPSPSRLHFSRVSNRFALAPLSYCEPLEGLPSLLFPLFSLRVACSYEIFARERRSRIASHTDHVSRQSVRRIRRANVTEIRD